MSACSPPPESPLPDAHVRSGLARLRRATASTVTFLGHVEGDTLRLARFDGAVVGPLRGVRLDCGEGLGGWVLAERRASAVRDYVGSSRISHRYDGIIRAESLRSMAAAPVIVGRRHVAVLYAATRSPTGEVGRLLDAVVGEARALEQSVAVAAALREATRSAEDDLSSLWRARIRDAYAELRSMAANTSDSVIRRRALAAAEGLVGRDVVRQAPVHLTARELDVLALLGQGFWNGDVAETLGISVHTVKSHVKSLMAKLGSTTRHEAVVQARRRGLLP